MSKNTEVGTAILKKMMLDALEANFGNVTKAARATKITTQAHYKWLKDDRAYAEDAENIKDISFRKVKENLLDKALQRIDQGDNTVLNKMLGIYFKHLPEEMERLSRYNNVPLMPQIRYVYKRDDPGGPDYQMPEEE